MAGKVYSSAGNRARLRQRGIKKIIPVKEDQKKHRHNRGRAGGQPAVFDVGWYTKRNTIDVGRHRHPARQEARTCTPLVPQTSRAGLARRVRTRGFRRQSGRTFSACGPFCPCVVSNSTFWFSSSDL